MSDHAHIGKQPDRGHPESAPFHSLENVTPVINADEHLRPAQVLQLQRQIGNRAVVQMLGQRRSTLQRFKNKDSDKADVTAEDIEKASEETLREWLAREGEPASWDSDDSGIVPDAGDRMLIEARLARYSEATAQLKKQDDQQKREAAQAAAEVERLKDLGLSADQWTRIKTVTEDASLIKKCTATCKTNTWDLTEILTALNGYSVTIQETVLSVLGKGEVTTQQALTTLAANWTSFQDRDAIDPEILIDLLKKKAITTAGGVYKIPQLTGTLDAAIKFYANGVTLRRIDPEWHVHATLRDGLQNPGFKRHDDAKKTGPGTRRVTAPAISQKIWDAVQ
jgi:hypothetical protein